MPTFRDISGFFSLSMTVFDMRSGPHFFCGHPWHPPISRNGRPRRSSYCGTVSWYRTSRLPLQMICTSCVDNTPRHFNPHSTLRYHWNVIYRCRRSCSDVSRWCNSCYSQWTARTCFASPPVHRTRKINHHQDYRLFCPRFWQITQNWRVFPVHGHVDRYVDRFPKFRRAEVDMLQTGKFVPWNNLNYTVLCHLHTLRYVNRYSHPVLQIVHRKQCLPKTCQNFRHDFFWTLDGTVQHTVTYFNEDA